MLSQTPLPAPALQTPGSLALAQVNSRGRSRSPRRGLKTSIMDIATGLLVISVLWRQLVHGSGKVSSSYMVSDQPWLAL